MPRLAIIDHAVNAGGEERFLHGLVGGLLGLDEFRGWETTVLLSKTMSGGGRVTWPDELAAADLRVRYLPLSTFWRRFMNRTADPRPVKGVPGSVGAQRVAGKLATALIPASVTDYWTRVREWIEGFCESGRFDVVYFSWPYFLDFPRIEAPVVCTPHDFNYKHFEVAGSAMHSRIESQMPGWLAGSARLVVSSDFIAGELRRFYPDFAGKARVVRLGLPEVAPEPTGGELAACRKRFGLPERYVLVAGWITRHKNQKTVLEAVGELKRRGRSVPLVCVGPNSKLIKPGAHGAVFEEVAEFLETGEKLGLVPGEDYLGLGYVEDRDLVCLYRLATALVVPSLYEAGSFPAREAMRTGCPVVYSRIPPLTEELELVGGNAWTFDPHDPSELANVVESLIEKPEEARERASRAGALVAGVFSWERTAKGYLEVFSEVIL